MPKKNSRIWSRCFVPISTVSVDSAPHMVSKPLRCAVQFTCLSQWKHLLYQLPARHPSHSLLGPGLHHAELTVFSLLRTRTRLTATHDTLLALSSCSMILTGILRRMKSLQQSSTSLLTSLPAIWQLFVESRATL